MEEETGTMLDMFDAREQKRKDEQKERERERKRKAKEDADEEKRKEKRKADEDAPPRALSKEDEKKDEAGKKKAAVPDATPSKRHRASKPSPAKLPFAKGGVGGDGSRSGPVPKPNTKPTPFAGGKIYVDPKRVRSYKRSEDRVESSSGYRDAAAFKIAWGKAVQAIIDDPRLR